VKLLDGRRATKRTPFGVLKAEVFVAVKLHIALLLDTTLCKLKSTYFYSKNKGNIFFRTVVHLAEELQILHETQRFIPVFTTVYIVFLS
jgi:hypothetical protein